MHGVPLPAHKREPGLRKSLPNLFLPNDAVDWNGAPGRARTADPLITNQVLYQLSYKGMSG